jgi:UDP-glucuronate 4-epimerase
MFIFQDKRVKPLIDRHSDSNPNWDERVDDLSTSFAPYKIYNIGNNQPVPLMKFINGWKKRSG